MKKLIALGLALIMLISLASAAFTDADKIDTDFSRAVEAMAKIGIINGMSDGSFQPEATLTRAQAAKIICAIKVGTDKLDGITAAASGFADVPAGHWAEKFINWCAEEKIVAGVGNSKFNPNGELTGAAFLKMLLVAYGHDAAELTGDKWVKNTYNAVKAKGLYHSNIDAANKPVERQMACQMAYNFYMPEYMAATQPEGYKETTIDLTGKTTKVKLLGRATADADGVRMHCPCDGIEFTMECMGDIVLNLASTDSSYFLIFVDGVQMPRFRLSAETIALRHLEAGEHTIRILRNGEYSTTKGTNAVFTGISLMGKPETLKPTAQKKLYVEFLGDSITAGSGALGTPQDAMSPDVGSAVESYAYKAAQLLDADYAIVAKGSIGMTKGPNDIKGDQIYLKQNPYQDPDKEADFSRHRDAVVIGFGANDQADSDFPQLIEAFAKKVREKVGPDTKIIFIHNMMVIRHQNTLETVTAKLGGAEKGYYCLKLQRGINGVPATPVNTPHPSAADHSINAPILADFIKSILPK